MQPYTYEFQIGNHVEWDNYGDNPKRYSYDGHRYTGEIVGFDDRIFKIVILYKIKITGFKRILGNDNPIAKVDQNVFIDERLLKRVIDPKNIEKKAINQSIRNVVEERTGHNSTPGSGIADYIREFVGVQPHKGSYYGGKRNHTRKTKTRRGRSRKI
jgi:hypothetical protein